MVLKKVLKGKDRHNVGIKNGCQNMLLVKSPSPHILFASDVYALNIESYVSNPKHDVATA